MAMLLSAVTAAPLERGNVKMTRCTQSSEICKIGSCAHHAIQDPWPSASHGPSHSITNIAQPLVTTNEKKINLLFSIVKMRQTQRANADFCGRLCFLRGTAPRIPPAALPL